MSDPAFKDVSGEPCRAVPTPTAEEAAGPDPIAGPSPDPLLADLIARMDEAAQRLERLARRLREDPE